MEEEVKEVQQNAIGSVYCWGLGKEGQLGYGDTENVPTPKQVKIKNVIEVKAGGQFSGCVTSQGDVLMFGSNKRCQLGQDIQQNFPVPIQVKELSKIKQIALGDWHSLAVDKDGLCFGCGYNKNGCLGIENLEMVGKFQKIPIENQIEQINAGRNISLFISFDKNILSAGISFLNGNKKQIDQFSVQAIQKLKETKIVNASAGFSTCAAVSEEGQLYTWGKGLDFSLGHGNQNDVNEPLSVQKFIENDIKIVQVSCSRSEKYVHMGAVDISGHVYTWGSGYKAKLGHGKSGTTTNDGGYSVEKQPKQIEYLKDKGRSKQFINGGIHSAVLMENGQLLTFGCGSDGRLGHPEMGNHRYLYKEEMPKSIKTFENKRVLQAFSSYYHMIALVEEKQK